MCNNGRVRIVLISTYEMGRQPRTMKAFLEKYKGRVLFGTDMGRDKAMYQNWWRLLDTLQFLYELQCEAYDRYIAAVRKAGYDAAPAVDPFTQPDHEARVEARRYRKDLANFALAAVLTAPLVACRCAAAERSTSTQSISPGRASQKSFQSKLPVRLRGFRAVPMR